MAEAQVRGSDGKFVAAPPPGPIDQADGKALDTPNEERSIGDLEREWLENDPRINMMKRARVKRAEEHGLTVEGDASEEKLDTNPADFKDANEPDKVDALQEKVQPEPGVEPHIATLADTDLVEIKVNGEMKKLPWGEAKKSLQLGAATEETLEKAKAVRAAAETELAAARAVRAVMPQASAPLPERVETKEVSPEEAVATAKGAKDKAFDAWEQAVRYGTDEEIVTAKKALRDSEDALDKAKDDRQAKNAPRGDGTDVLLTREVADSERAQEKYLETFKADQSDDLFRAAMAMKMRKELIADLTKIGAPAQNVASLSDHELGAHHRHARSRGLVRTLDAVLTAAGTQARDELKARAAPTSAPLDPRLQRQQAKEGTPSPPRSAAGRVPEPEPEKPMTSKEALAEMRRRRGKA